MIARFAIPCPDTTTPDRFRLDDFWGYPEAAEAHERDDWRLVGEGEPVEITGRAA